MGAANLILLTEGINRTVRKRRDQLTRRPAEVRVKYRIRPLVTPGPGLEAVTNIPEKTYEGQPVPLAYADEGFVTNDILITTKHGDIRAAFAKGILSAQWLQHALEELGERPDDHYRFRAVQQERRGQGKEQWNGFLSRDAKWLETWLESDKGNLARYFSGLKA